MALMEAQLGGPSRPFRRADVRLYAIDDEAVLYDLAHDTVHYLNNTSLFIWERCDGTRTAEELAVELAAASREDACNFGSDGNTLSAVHTALAGLEKNGLMNFAAP
jgi:hypothetical protein